VRGDRTEQGGLIPERSEVGQAVPTIGQGDSQVRQDPTWQVHRRALIPDPPSCPLLIMVRRDLVVQGVRARRYGRAGRLVSTMVSG